MTWSPQSPVRTSHGNRSLSFELSPSISHAVGAPIVATGPTTPSDHHGLRHSPHDHDMFEKVRAKKIVAEAMRGNPKLRQAVTELSMISATETLGKANKKQKLGTSRIADRGSPPGRARSASGASEPKNDKVSAVMGMAVLATSRMAFACKGFHSQVRLRVSN